MRAAGQAAGNVSETSAHAEQAVEVRQSQEVPAHAVGAGGEVRVAEVDDANKEGADAEQAGVRVVVVGAPTDAVEADAVVVPVPEVVDDELDNDIAEIRVTSITSVTPSRQFPGFKCDECENVSWTEGDLWTHMKQHHPG